MKFKVTVLDSNLNKPVAEILDQDYWPNLCYPYHSLQNGAGYGMPIRVEIIMEASESDTTDNT